MTRTPETHAAEPYAGLCKVNRNDTENATFPWSDRSERAALALAEGRHVRDVARELGIHRNTLGNWRRCPAFKARVRAHLDVFRKQLETARDARWAAELDALDARIAAKRKRR